MAKRNNTLKPVVVKEHPVQSLAEAGIYDLRLDNGTKIVAVANTLFPNHDENTVQMILSHIEATRPEVIFLLGHMADEDSFRSLADTEVNFLHRIKDAAALSEAMANDGFEEKVLALGKANGDFIKRFAAFGASVFYIPSWTNVGLPNELGIMDYVQMKKRFLDSWAANHPDASDVPSDPSIALPSEIDALFGIDGLENIQVLPYGAAVLVNDRTLFMVGSFRRRAAGDSAQEEWAQRGYDIVKSVDGKSGSAWWTDVEHTMPEPVYNQHQTHEIGYLWSAKRNGHLGDYHRRSQSFGAFTIYFDHLFGEVVPVIPGKNGRRSILVEGVSYTEATAGAKKNGGTLKLAHSKSEPVKTNAPTRRGAAARTTRTGKR
ncbi:hypothetical protein BH10CYA1_BH10CYA1_42170 [soil metagenome]